MSIFRFNLLEWLNAKIVDPLMQIVRRGAEPKQLALSTAVGLTLGVFPICGTTVVLCGVAIAILGDRCNAPTTMLFNFVATPIELSLIVPFLRLGELVCGGPHFALTPDAFKKVITGHASKEVLFSILHAILGWLIATPFMLVLLYMIFLPCFKLLAQRFGTVPSSPTKQIFSHADIKLKLLPP
ncbi:E3 ubiquitin-protein ligase [Rhynchospora pubera]|uniref:E3 ubiquitin-protein ligase n=2 Tax=Rhynchospora pubera TaxID=906938 RepID=A0AAV8CQM3_9POAL|nr:E3 ubiquitin-protein ligase [Rhynchospora pubera]KAJ4809993.1 E3 ubiquitin-protein ligase [Rhynchospora pubera]